MHKRNKTEYNVGFAFGNPIVGQNQDYYNGKIGDTNESVEKSSIGDAYTPK